MTGQQGSDAPTSTDVLIALAEIKGQLTPLIGISMRHDTDLRALDNRVTTLEAQRKAGTPWHVTLGAIIPSVALVLLVAERLYGK